MHCIRKFSRTAARQLKMKVVQFKINDGDTRIGILKGDNVIDINASDQNLPNSLVELLKYEDVLDKLEEINVNPQKEYSLSKVQLLSPITKPDKILGLAANYKGDCDKRNVPYPQEPILFSKFPSVIIGPYDPIPKAAASNKIDWEGELVVVIGKKAKNVKAESAYDYIFGYTATQDLTAKDWVNSLGQLTLCKNFEGFCPLGPCVVTKDELGDPHNIRVRTWVNGELKQDGNSEEMIFRVDQIIECLSRTMTLLPGDIICTGTPYGVGSSQNPPQFLKEGDLLETEVEKIGRLANRFIPE